MFLAAVNNVCLAHTAIQGSLAAVYFGDHATLYNFCSNEVINLIPVDGRDKLSLAIFHSFHIGEQNELKGL